MKSGAGDDPFAEPAVRSDSGDTEASDAEADETDGADGDAEAEAETGTGATAPEADADSAGAESEPRTNGSAETADSDDESAESDGSATSEDDGDAATQEIPYKFRRSSVKEGRTQRPIFVREAVEERESEFIRTLEEAVGEKVYKTDAMEAALIVAMDNPDLVAEELREWGYDWE